jgi:polyisoprenoid-binding protein YceI
MKFEFRSSNEELGKGSAAVLLHSKFALRTSKFAMAQSTMRVSLALAVALTASAALADSRTYEIRKGGKSVAEFHAEDSYDSFDGKTNAISGTIVADPANPSAATVNLTVDITSLETGVALRNREMGELYLESGKYPNATFKSASVEAP